MARARVSWPALFYAPLMAVWAVLERLFFSTPSKPESAVFITAPLDFQQPRQQDLVILRVIHD